MERPPAPRAPGLRAIALLPASVAAIAAFAAGTTWALQNAASERAVESKASTLTDDDGDRPLFTLPRLVPGQRISRCIRVRHDGADDMPISVIGTGATGPLAGLVDLQIETGSGGSYADCAGFAGTPIFRGTLGEFQARSAATEIGIVAYTSRPSLRERTFRFTVELRDDQGASGQSSQMAFTWLAGATPNPASGASVTTPAAAGPVTIVAEPQESTTGSSTDDDRAATGAEGPAGSTTTTILDEPVPARTGAARQRTERRRAPAAGRPSTPVAGPLAPLAAKGDGRDRSLVEKVATAARDVAVRAAFPLLLAIIAGLFLLVQHRLDARDPKLALAPVHRDPDLAFGPVPPPGEPL